jgi:hypothetical protein
MDNPNLAAPQEASRDLVEIRDEDAITIDAALTIAAELPFALGKSTLQRWAKFWREQPGGAVRSVLVTTRTGSFYRLSRDDFQAWLFEQKQNDRSHETPRDLMRPSKTSQDPARSHEVSGEVQENTSRLKELENENMQLKIDVGVRKQLLELAKVEMDDLRSMANGLLRENASLEYQLRQLAAPKQNREAEPPPPSAPVDNSTHDVATPGL